jgi:predicted ferric reductase
MKTVLLVACAFFYAFLPAITDFQHAIFILLVPVMLGLVYFVFHRHEWGGPLLPWLFACTAVGRVAAYRWLNVRRGRTGPIVDQDVWVCGGLAGLCFVLSFWKWLRDRTETPNPENGSSA